MTIYRLIFHFAISFAVLSAVILVASVTREMEYLYFFDLHINCPSIQSIFIALIVSIIAAAGSGILFFKSRKETSSEVWYIKWQWEILGYALFIKLIWLYLIWQSGFTLLSTDDLWRMAFSHRWAGKPFFAVEDFVWLAGQFYLYGIGEWIYSDPLVVARFFGIFAGLGVTALLYRVTVHLFDHLTAFIVLVLIVFEPHLNWLTIAPLPGVYFALGIILAFYFLARWYESPWGWIGASFGLLLASTMRHEILAWILIFLGLLIIHCWYRWKNISVIQWVIYSFAVLIPTFYIAAWLYMCAKVNGSPFHFLARIEAFTYEFKFMTTPEFRIAYYPILFFKTSPIITSFGVLGLLAFLYKPIKSTQRWYAVALILSALSMELSVLRGAAATNLPWRVFLTLLILLVPSAVFCGIKMWEFFRNQYNNFRSESDLCWGTLLVFTLVVFIMSSFAYPMGRGITPESLETASYARKIITEMSPNVENFGSITVNNPSDSLLMNFYVMNPKDFTDLSGLSQDELNEWKENHSSGIIITDGMFPPDLERQFTSGAFRIYSWSSSSVSSQ